MNVRCPLVVGVHENPVDQGDDFGVDFLGDFPFVFLLLGLVDGQHFFGGFGLRFSGKLHQSLDFRLLEKSIDVLGRRQTEPRVAFQTEQFLERIHQAPVKGVAQNERSFVLLVEPGHHPVFPGEGNGNDPEQKAFPVYFGDHGNRQKFRNPPRHLPLGNSHRLTDIVDVLGRQRGQTVPNAGGLSRLHKVQQGLLELGKNGRRLHNLPLGGNPCLQLLPAGTCFDLLVNLLEQNVFSNRLGQVVRRAHCKGFGPVYFIIQGRQENHGNELGFRIGLQFKTGHVAVDFRHHHVHQNQIRPPALGFINPLLSIPGNDDRIAGPGQNLLEQIQNIRIVINTKDRYIVRFFRDHFASLENV